MATWDAVRVSDIVEDIHDGRVVLPVIQRRLVWNESKMELLFDSLLRGNSFGGIMVLQETQANAPLFAFRRFSLYGEELASALQAKLAQKTLIVIDGQQRLQAFYMGLRGGINNKQLYFNLLGRNDEYEFRFAYQETDLPAQESDDEGTAARKLWYHAPTLFDHLQMVQSDKQVANEIAAELGVTDGDVKDSLEDNVSAFFLSIFVWKAIGLSSVTVNKTQVKRERRRIVELFRRLNDGGTRLSSFDLAASMFKGFDGIGMESFFRDVRQFGDVGIGQDEVIKLIFLLQGSHAKEVTDIEASDAEFVIENRERIIAALHVLRTFLKNAKLYNYYQSAGRSVIPLYFIAYHVFHKDVPTAQLGSVYDNYDAKNDDFVALKRWVYISLLNGVFSRGVGWIPYRTGIRKILDTLKGYKKQVFPTEVLFNVYRRHPLTFSSEITADQIDLWDRDFAFYLMYGCESLADRDIDHVHPKSRLDAAGVAPHQIHSLANFQLLDQCTNRNEKRARTLAEWLTGGGVSDQDGYLRRHLIPTCTAKWEIAQFDAFLQERAAKIVEKVQSFIPEPVGPMPVSMPEEPSSEPIAASTLDRASLIDELPANLQRHPILEETAEWYHIYRQLGYSPQWAGRYRSGLATMGIRTVADLALCAMARGLEVWYASDDNPVLKFHEPPTSGGPMVIQSFGGWAWKAVLDEFDKRGFDWRQCLSKPTFHADEGTRRARLLESLRGQLTSEQRGHPILENDTTWHDFFSARVNRTWAGRYRNELASAGIETVADLALFIMALGLEFCYSYQWGNVFRFARPAPDGQQIELETKSFGGWAWSTALAELKARGFDWEAFVVNPDDLREKSKR